MAQSVPSIEDDILELSSVDNNEKLASEVKRLFHKLRGVIEVPVRQKLKSKLHNIALNVLDGPLREIVQKSGLSEKAGDFVIKDITTINELAKLVYMFNQKDDQMSRQDRVFIMDLKTCVSKLGRDLETMGALAYYKVDMSASWVSKLIESCPTIKLIQYLPQEYLKSYLMSASSHDKEIVHQLYNSTDDSRKELRQVLDTEYPDIPRYDETKQKGGKEASINTPNSELQLELEDEEFNRDTEEYFGRLRSTALKMKMPFPNSNSDLQKAASQRQYNLPKLRESYPDYTRVDFCLDRAPNSMNPYEFMIDSLRKRKNIFSLSIWKDKRVSVSLQKQNTKCSMLQDAFITLINLVERCDLTAKMELFQLLIEQGYTVPLVVATKNADTVMCFVDALRFVYAKFESRPLPVMSDSKLSRVAFLSQRNIDQTQNASIIQQALQCNVCSSCCKAHVGTTAEFGIGVLPNWEGESEDYSPWFILYIRGNYRPLLPLVAMFADIIVVELDPKTDVRKPLADIQSLELPVVLRWQITVSKLKTIIEGDINAITGSDHDIANEMADTLPNLKQKYGQNKNHQSFDEINVRLALSGDEIELLDGIKNRSTSLNFNKMRSTFVLQESFAKENQFRLEKQRIRRDETQIEEMDVSMDNEVLKRCAHAELQCKLPILDLFQTILGTSDSIKRFLGLKQFERVIESGSEVLLQSENEKVQSAWSLYDANRKDDNALKQYNSAKAEHASKVVGLEHLWRELSLMYVAKPQIYSNFPKFAAQHLLDGFPLEIMDGDAASVNTIWFKSVINALNSCLAENLGRDPKVFVISAMGPQSTGKSTILNTMFGCKLRTSTGKCTHGVYLQLVKAQNRSFDFILVLDTQGIRSPEFQSSSDAVWKDNRMATFAILPADACLITAVNEDDTAIKEVLPIVMLSFRRSSIAQCISERMQSLIIFVYSRVETSEHAQKNLQQNRRQLLIDLQEAVKQIEGQSIAEEGQFSESTKTENETLLKFISNFRTRDEESESDVKYLGPLSREGQPGLDPPNFEYGEKIEQIREYLQRRLEDNDFRCRSLMDWFQYLELVLQCIDTSDFELNFRTSMQYSAYNNLSTIIAGYRRNVSEKYSQMYEECQTDLLNATEMPKLEDFLESLANKVQATIQANDTVVNKTLTSPMFREFKYSEKSKWESFLDHQRILWQSLVRTTFDNKWKYSEEEEKYEEEIFKTLRKAFNSDQKRYEIETEQKALFDKIFKKQKAKAEENNPAMNVKEKILDEYERIQQINLMAIKTPWSISKSFKSLTETLFRDKSKVKQISKQLCAQVEDILRGVQRYDPNIVQKAIELTTNTIGKNPSLSRSESELHRKVCDLLTDKFIQIQKQWESNNNIAARLHASKGRMWAKFKRICNGFVGAHSVSSDLNEGLKQAVKEGFKNYHALKVKTNLYYIEWLARADEMQAHIDLDLISMIDSGNINEMLNALCHPSEHYKCVLYKLIGKNSDSRSSWKSMIWTIEEALRETISLIQPSATNTVATFRDEFIKKLPNTIKEKFSSMTWRYILNEKKEFDRSLWKEIEHLLQKSIKVWDKGFSEKVCNSVTEETLGNLVSELLEREGHTSTRPRCSKPCPICKMTCIKEAGHQGDYTSIARKHDCPHQPGGLVGGFWTESSRFHPNELVAHSCTEAVANGYLFEITPDQFVPFSDFCTYFPSWCLPNITQRQKLREYIFYNYQTRLASKYQRLRCSYISQRYNHHLLELKIELTEKIKYPAGIKRSRNVDKSLTLIER